MKTSSVDLFLRRGPFVGGRAEPPAAGGAPTPPATPPAEPMPPATPPAEPVAPPATPPAAAAPPATPPVAPSVEPSEWEVAFGRGITPRQVQDYIMHLTRQAQTPPTQPPPAAPAPNLKELIFEDPEKALDHHFSTRIAPALAAVIDQTSQVVGEVVGTQRDAKGELTMPHFNKYRGEIEQFVGRVDPRLRGRRETWQSAYNYVVGQHLNEIVQEEIGRRVPAVEAGGGAPAPTKGPKIELSPEQAATAAAMGMTPEEYMEWK